MEINSGMVDSDRDDAQQNLWVDMAIKLPFIADINVPSESGEATKKRLFWSRPDEVEAPLESGAIMARQYIDACRADPGFLFSMPSIIEGMVRVEDALRNSLEAGAFLVELARLAARI